MNRKMLVSGIPDKLDRRFKALIPRRQRSKFLLCLLENAIEKREHELYECAKRVEKDELLNQDLQIWDNALDDGLYDSEEKN